MSHTASDFPDEFISRLRRIVPRDAWEMCLATFHGPEWVAFRVNALKASNEEVLGQFAENAITPRIVPWLDYAFAVPAAQRSVIVNSPEAQTGHIYVQNLSSMLPVILLDARPGDSVLDLAAAPGGKTTHLGQMMQNQGHISAVEVVRGRMFKLRDTLKRCGVTIAKTYLTDGRSVGRKTPERFDRVLLDAPCTGEARFRAGEPKTWGFWSARKIREQSRKQKGLLKSAIGALKVGGTLVYCTCSFSPEENEMVVDQQLRRFGDQIELIPLELPIHNVQCGLKKWNDRQLHEDLVHACRVLPNGEMDAFFLCMIRKVASTVIR